MRYPILYGGYKRYFRDKSEYQYEPVPTDKRTTFPHNALWSSPRSGNHWVRFIAEYLTGHPTCGYNDNPKDKPIFTNRFPSTSHPLAHVSSKRPYILYKSHRPYPLLNGSTIILLVRNINEKIALWVSQGLDMRYKIAKRFRRHLGLIKAYDEFSGAKILIYYEDLLLSPEREIFRIKHFLGASNSRYKDFMNHYDYYTYLSKHALMRDWSVSHSGLDFNFYRKGVPKEQYNKVKESTQFLHQLLADPEYQRVKSYIARYM